jgi:hypothetical protein
MEQNSVNIGTLFRLISNQRKLILTTFLVIVGIAVLIYLVLPLFGVVAYRKPPEYVGRMELTVLNYPSEASRAIDLDVPLWAARRFRDLTLVSSAYSATIGLPEGLDQTQALTYVEERVLPRLSARWDLRLRVISVSFVAAEPDGITEFLQLLENSVRQEARLAANELLRLNKRDLETAQADLVRDLASAVEADGSTASDALTATFRDNSGLLLSYLRLAVEELATEQALSSSALPWRETADVTVVQRNDDSLLASRGRGLTIALFAGLVFSLLLAVVADYLRYQRARTGSQDI